MKNTKFFRTMLTVALVLTIIGSVTGGTIAWFTDAVESSNNIVKSGTLDIDLQLMDYDNDKWISLEKAPDTKVFDYDLWEPGFTQMETLKIINKGNLAFEYILKVAPGADEVKGPNGESLAEAIDVFMTFGEFEPTADNGLATRDDFLEVKNAGVDKTVNGNQWWYCGTLEEMITRASGFTKGVMLPTGKTSEMPGVVSGSVTCTVALHMDEEAGNEYQGLSLGTVGFTLEARQYTYESDSFNDQYDANAPWHSETNNESVPMVELPDANVVRIPDSELTVELSDLIAGHVGYPVDDMLTSKDPDTLTMDYALTFTATETPADLAGKPYENWNADFEVILNKPITSADFSDEKNALVLVGEFGDWGWCAVPANVEVDANVPVRLLYSVKGSYSYADVLNLVGTFNCGIKANPEWAEEGTSVTVRLMMYEVDESGNETNKFVVCQDTYTY